MEEAAKALRPAIISFQQTMMRLKLAKTTEATVRADVPAVVLQYKKSAKTPARHRVGAGSPFAAGTRVAAAR
jgi:hypothetical protein